MSLFSIHADYDRNGVLNTSPSEYGARQQLPGALITPNIDADGVSLPSTVACGSPPPLDLTQITKSAGDNDLIQILVRANAGTIAANFRVVLKVSAADSEKINLYDSSRHRMQGSSSGGITTFSLTFTATDVVLFLEVITVNGSPRLTPTSLSVLLKPITQPIILTIDVFDPANNLVESDFGYVTPSPLILLGDHAPAERFYICDISQSPATISDNFPSFTDVREAVRTIRGVSFIPVPVSVSRGDSWLQDQFQVGYCQSASSRMKVILHLPRLRSDARLSTDGLSCMATNHFPSTNLGVLNDFWTRSIPVRDVDRGTQNIPFINTVEIQMLFNRVFDLNSYLLRIVFEVNSNRFQEFVGRHFLDVGEIILSIDEFKNSVVQILDDALSRERDSAQRQRLNNTKTDIQTQIPTLLRDINFRTDGALVARTQNLTLALEPEDVADISERLDAVHSSHNYGGNIEVTPPVSTAPLGKILIGDAMGENGKGQMDPDLVRFLGEQNEQPVVLIDTTWLDVGHVDEIVNFAPIRNSGNAFAVVLASPEKAYQILEEIFILNTQDLSDSDPAKELYGRPYTIGDSNMVRGPHPVTRLLRGKSWLQSYRVNDRRVMPPKIYTDMSRFYRGITSSERRFYPIPWVDDHYYDAQLSVREILYFSRYSNNAAIEKMRTVKEVLEDEFPTSSFIELPVIFDNFNAEASEKTIAFIPDLINYQTVNNNVIIPRPYGPRMSIADTITVLRAVMGSEYSSFLTRQHFQRKNLNVTSHWAFNTINQLSQVTDGVYNRPVTIDLDWLAEQFKDGFFPAITDLDQMKTAIRRANPGKFLPNGNLRNGWHKLRIPENKVDVFEAYTQIMLESIGMTVKWVDSWYYHLRSGGIHCGTNVIRTPDFSNAKAWWNVSPTGRYGPGDFNLPDPNADTQMA